MRKAQRMEVTVAAGSACGFPGKPTHCTAQSPELHSNPTIPLEAGNSYLD